MAWLSRTLIARTAASSSGAAIASTRGPRTADKAASLPALAVITSPRPRKPCGDAGRSASIPSSSARSLASAANAFSARLFLRLVDRPFGGRQHAGRGYRLVHLYQSLLEELATGAYRGQGRCADHGGASGLLGGAPGVVRRR